MISFPQIFRRLFRLMGAPKPTADARAAGVPRGTGDEPRDTRETVARAARKNDRRNRPG